MFKKPDSGVEESRELISSVYIFRPWKSHLYHYKMESAETRFLKHPGHKHEHEVKLESARARMLKKRASGWHKITYVVYARCLPAIYYVNDI